MDSFRIENGFIASMLITWWGAGMLFAPRLPILTDYALLVVIFAFIFWLNTKTDVDE